MQTVVTSGSKYIDIDVLACAIAYNELLSLIGTKSVCVLCGPTNETIPEIVRNWAPSFQTKLEVEADSFVLVDVSNPDFFPDFVDHSKIGRVYDHRKGFENYWHARLGGHNIEIVGSCATLIWEEYIAHKVEHKISFLAANLLFTAIFSNTLNMTAKITHKRDRAALDALRGHVNVPDNFIELYYKQTLASVLRDPETALINDRKVLQINGAEYCIGQLEMWSAKLLLSAHDMVSLSKKILGDGCDRWFLTMPSISEGKNYLITTSEETKVVLKKIYKVDFSDNIAVLPNVMLRKEIQHDLQAEA